MASRLAPTLLPPDRQRVPAGVRVGLIVLLVLLVVTVGLLVGLRVARAGTTLPGVSVAGVDVGGVAEERLVAAVSRADRSDEVITITADDDEATATAGELGYRFDADATAEAAYARGRQINPVTALRDHLRATFGAELPVARVHGLEGDALEAGAAGLAEQLGREPVEGEVRFAGTAVERTEPEPGRSVDVDALVDELRPVVRGEADSPVIADTDPVPPETTTEDVDALVADAERAVSAPIELTRDDVTWTLAPETLASVLHTEREGGDLALVADADAVEEAAGDVPDEVHADSVDATVRLGDGGPEVVPSEEGFAFDADAAADQIVEVATDDGDRVAELDGRVLEPDRTTADAEALEITEQVSTFTTEFQPGQSRVTNIHRIADMVDGEVIWPDDAFSVNDHVGERTRDKGFVEGGAIFDGEFIEAVGGGVSQFATTLYNAAYFGGYAIDEFQPHSYYISRYPPGREATLDYPHIDLNVRNNSPHGVLIDTSYTASSVTVTLWGTQWVQVDSEAGPRTDVTDPPVRHREEPGLPQGTERVVQSGRQGFTITVTRVLRFPDGTEEREPVTTRYLPEPRIIAVGTAEAPADDEDEDEDDEPDDEDDDDGGGDDDGDDEESDDGNGDDD